MGLAFALPLPRILSAASIKTVLLSSLPATGTLQPERHPHQLLPGKRIGLSIESLIDGHSEDPLMTKTRRRARKKRARQSRSQVVDVLPDDVLLAIFDFCVNQHLAEDFLSVHDKPMKKEIEVWQPLVHVCRKWRSVVFGSPRHLNLRLVCTANTPAKDTLDVWPALPLLIWAENYSKKGLENVIPVLEHRDRVSQIGLSIPVLQWRNFLAAMAEPFPELTRMKLRSDEDKGMAAILPDMFLGGSAPRLRFLWLEGFQFKSSPKLFLSAAHLSILFLKKIPHSGCISPEEVVTVLSMLTSLGLFVLEFTSPRPRHDRASHPPTRSVLPVLMSLMFTGACEYLEDLVARIDSPQLFGLDITFFGDFVFETPQLVQFIRRIPMSKALKNAHVIFWDDVARVNLSSLGSRFGVSIMCRDSNRQASSLEQVCTSCLPSIFTLEDLYIYEAPSSQPEWKDDIENTQWLELLRPFTTVRSLYLSKTFAPRVAALQELVGGTTDVLPMLQNIILEELEPSGTVQEGVGQFVAARQDISHQIAVSRWETPESDKVPL